MNYHNGPVIEIGDIVEIQPGVTGIVVCMPSSRKFTDDYSAKDWSEVDGDILVETENKARILLKLDYPHLKFLGRKA